MFKLFRKTNDFEWVAIKLSLFYVLIAMVISISFSVVIFNVSKFEVGRGIGRNIRMIDEYIAERRPPGFENIEKYRQDQLDEINDRLRNRLVYFNLIILVISSALSYFLAKKTLHPLEQAMESQRRFSADASHELRTPLATIRVENEVALRDKNLSKDEAKKNLRSNIEEIEKLEHLSDALLKLAHYEHNGFNFTKQNISDALVEAYGKVEKLAATKQIVFQNDFKNVEIFGDKQSLIELFVIFLDNAIKYSPDKSKIEVSVTKSAKSVLVKIKDHGVGIKTSELPFIFERFYRADSSRTKTKVNGYGLGLSLAKQIVDLHGGEISVTSIAGKGSEFIILLPKDK